LGKPKNRREKRNVVRARPQKRFTDSMTRTLDIIRRETGKGKTSFLLAPRRKNDKTRGLKISANAKGQIQATRHSCQGKQKLVGGKSVELGGKIEKDRQSTRRLLNVRIKYRSSFSNQKEALTRVERGHQGLLARTKSLNICEE